MKKFFSLMLFAASLLAVSCDDNNDDNNDRVDDKYTGTLETTYVGMTPMPAAAMPAGAPSAMNIEFPTQENVIFIFEDENNLGDLTMPAVSFTGTSFTMNGETKTGMPSLYIKFNDVPESTIDDTFKADSVTPLMADGSAHDNNVLKSIDNVKIVESNDKLAVEFDCTVQFSDKMPAAVICKVKYIGTEVRK